MVQNKRVLDSTTGMTYPYGYEPTEAIFDAITLPVLFEEKEEPQRDAEPLGLRHTFPLVTGFKRELKSTVKVKKKHVLIAHAPFPTTYHKDWSTLSSPNIRVSFLYSLLRAKGLRVPLLEHTKVPMTSLPLPLQFPREYSRD